MNGFDHQLPQLQPKLQLHDRRRHWRTRTLKAGRLHFGGFSLSTVDCLIVDLSDSGARIETGVMVNTPDVLFLNFVGGSTRACTRRWANGNEIGLEFLPEPARNVY